MNDTLALLHSHHSDRDFTDAPVDEADLAAVVEAAHRAPTSMNGQQVSLVVVRDPARRARLAELAGGQPWIARAPVFLAVLIDFHKTRVAASRAGREQAIHRSLEGFTVGAVDAGIALASLMLAARSLGMGVVPIGSLRRDPQGVIDLLRLPPLTYPVVGAAVGHVAEPATRKPRLPLAAFRHDEVYRAEGLPAAIEAYDRTLLEHWRAIGRADGLRWSENTGGAYSRLYFPRTRPVAERQGFTLEE
ncbi:MAG TPA: NADPH-dependent oxidoreductase [Anaeromyxobacter sp.]|nr:NADPH-dependent oxidoreductase [Anaeromyxobacter sp.]